MTDDMEKLEITFTRPSTMSDFDNLRLLAINMLAIAKAQCKSVAPEISIISANVLYSNAVAIYEHLLKKVNV